MSHLTGTSEADGYIGTNTFMVDKVSHDRRVSELLAANNRDVAKRRAATALLLEAGEHIVGTTGALPGSDSAEIVSRIETFLAEIFQ